MTDAKKIEVEMTEEEITAAEMANAEKIKANQLYFIQRLLSFFENEANILSKRGESFRYLIEEIILTSKDIKNVNNQVEVTRLSKALKYQINELEHIFNNNILFNGSLKTDTEQLLKLISNLKQKKNSNTQKDAEDVSIYSLELNKFINSLIAFNKKLNQKRLISDHFERIGTIESSIAYDQIDFLIESLINELLFVCSPSFIIERFEKASKTLDTEHLGNCLKSLCRILTDHTAIGFTHEFIFKLELSDRDQSLKNQLTNIKSDYIFDDIKLRSMKDIIENFDKIERHLISEKKQLLYIKKTIVSNDIYKASSIAYEEMKNFLNTYTLVDNYYKVEINPKGLYRKNNEDKWIMRDIVFHNTIQEKTINSRERNDIEAFINLRNRRLLNNGSMKDLFLIERAYDLSHPSTQLTIENNLLNSWLAIEYIVTPYISSAIIEKVRQVLPKVVSLYYIKGLMNEVWISLNDYNLSGNETVIDFIKECKDPDSLEDWKYQKVKFAEQLKDDDEVSKVIDSLSEHRVLIRKLRELNGLINKRKQVRQKLKNVHQSIEFDLNRIYRLRNKIVHSGVNVPNDLELVVIRLMKYNNHLLGTIIHYMTLNDETNLEDVLNSIVETYNWYIDEKTNITDINDIVTPKYLYL